ncbi:hypothetical protein Tco_0758546 [Tanacetum coccineum]
MGFRMELVQGATPICEGSCHLTPLRGTSCWNACKSCKVRVGSNGNSLWEASVLLGRKKGGRVYKDDVAKTVFRMRNGHVEVYGYAFWVNQCTSGFHGANEPGGVRVAHEDDRRVSEGREDVREVFQQHESEAKRKLSRGGRNQMEDVRTLAIEEAYTTKYPIHPGADATECGLRFLTSFLDDGRGTAEFMDREVKSLKRSKIVLVQIRWDSKRGPEFTWERKDRMRSKCP